MPTIQPPQKSAPMEASPVITPTIISQQPSAQPRPEAEPQMTLRGGGFNIGCDCCSGACRFNKHCC